MVQQIDICQNSVIMECKHARIYRKELLLWYNYDDMGMFRCALDSIMTCHSRSTYTLYLGTFSLTSSSGVVHCFTETSKTVGLEVAWMLSRGLNARSRNLGQASPVVRNVVIRFLFPSVRRLHDNFYSCCIARSSARPPRSLCSGVGLGRFANMIQNLEGYKLSVSWFIRIGGRNRPSPTMAVHTVCV